MDINTIARENIKTIPNRCKNKVINGKTKYSGEKNVKKTPLHGTNFKIILRFAISCNYLRLFAIICDLRLFAII